MGMHSKREPGKANQVRTARRASELILRPPTITKSIDQLGEPVAAHRSVRSLSHRPRF